MRVRISPKTRAYVRFLRIEGRETVREVAKICSMSPASVVRIIRKPVGGNGVAQSVPKLGRPVELSLRQKRGLLRAMRILRGINADFTARDVMKECNIDESRVNVRTVQRFLNSKGYFYLQARKEGLLRRSDLGERLQFTRNLKRRESEQFWKEDIMFYFDGASFAQKTRPMDQAGAPEGHIWRKTL